MPRDGEREDRIRVEHMRLAALDVAELARGRVEGDLAAEMPLRRALVNAVQDIGEAASKVSAAGRSRVPSLPWDAIVAMRHRLVHGYSEIDADLLWRVITDEIGPLIAALDTACVAWKLDPAT